MYWYYVIGLIIFLVIVKALLTPPKINQKAFKFIFKMMQKHSLNYIIWLRFFILGCIFVSIGIFILLGLQPLLK